MIFRMKKTLFVAKQPISKGQKHTFKAKIKIRNPTSNKKLWRVPVAVLYRGGWLPWEENCVVRLWLDDLGDCSATSIGGVRGRWGRGGQGDWRGKGSCDVTTLGLLGRGVGLRGVGARVIRSTSGSEVRLRNNQVCSISLLFVDSFFHSWQFALYGWKMNETSSDANRVLSFD